MGRLACGLCSQSDQRAGRLHLFKGEKQCHEAVRGVKKTLKGEVEEEVEKEHREEDHAEGVEPVEYEKTMNGCLLYTSPSPRDS